MSQTLFLFDIDGTLLRTGGAGRRALSLATGRLFGRPDAFEGESFAGAVDFGLADRALRRIGVAPTPRRVGRLRATYVRFLRRTLQEHVGAGSAASCAGVPAAVALAREHGALGLLTGNWREGARAKLDAVGLWADFGGAVAATGSDARVREALLPIALRRARRRGLSVGRVVVIGDTPADVRCARAGIATLGSRAPALVTVAVATGVVSREALVPAEPDLLLDDLASGWAEFQSIVMSGC